MTNKVAELNIDEVALVSGGLSLLGAGMLIAGSTTVGSIITYNFICSSNKCLTASATLGAASFIAFTYCATALLPPSMPIKPIPTFEQMQKNVEIAKKWGPGHKLGY